MSGIIPTNDPAVDEVRDARRRISARFGHDPARLVRYYMELQEKYRDRLVPSPAPDARPGEGSRARYEEALSRVPDVEPDPRDRL